MNTEEKLRELEERVDKLEKVSTIMRSAHGFIARAVPEVSDVDVNFYQIINKENKIVKGYFVFEYKGIERVARLGEIGEESWFYIIIDGEKVDFKHKKNF